MKARINDIDCILYYGERLSLEEAPFSYPYMYQVRHDEDDWTKPISIERAVFVNFFGTVFMKEPVEFDENGCLDIDDFSMGKRLIKFKLKDEIFNNIFHPS